MQQMSQGVSNTATIENDDAPLRGKAHMPGNKAGLPVLIALIFIGGLLLSACGGVGSQDGRWVGKSAPEFEADRDSCLAFSQRIISQWQEDVRASSQHVQNDEYAQTGFALGVAMAKARVNKAAENAFKNCMVSRGWRWDTSGQATEKEQREFVRALLYQFPEITAETGSKLESIAEQTYADLGVGLGNPEFVREVGRRAMQTQTTGGKLPWHFYASKDQEVNNLHESIHKGDSRAALRHIKIYRRADVNGVNEFFGWTPLHSAAFRGHADIAAALLEAGAHINATDIDGRTAMDIATDKKHWEVVKALEESRAPGGGKKDDAQTAFDRGWRSVVVVTSSESQGSGVIVRPGIVATNCHVIGSGSSIRVYGAHSRRAQTDTPYRAAVYAERRDDDLCLLIVAGLGGDAAKIRRARTLDIGEKVFAIGAPKGLEYSLSAGVVSQLRSDGNKAPFIQTDAAISPGSSGGGLFDADGNLVGITTFKRRGAENINFAIPADWILDAL